MATRSTMNDSIHAESESNRPSKPNDQSQHSQQSQQSAALNLATSQYIVPLRPSNRVHRVPGSLYQSTDNSPGEEGFYTIPQSLNTQGKPPRIYEDKWNNLNKRIIDFEERHNEDHRRIEKLEQQLHSAMGMIQQLSACNAEQKSKIDMLDKDIDELFEGCDRLATWCGSDTFEGVTIRPADTVAQSQPPQSESTSHFGGRQSLPGQFLHPDQSNFNMHSISSTLPALPNQQANSQFNHQTNPQTNQFGTQYYPYQSQQQSNIGPGPMYAPSMPSVQPPAGYAGQYPSQQSGTQSTITHGQGQPQGYTPGQNYSPFGGQGPYGPYGAPGSGFGHSQQGPR